MIQSLVRNRQLILALSTREIALRYRGSALGGVWTIIQPIFMLAIYAFVFSEILKARWPNGTGDKAEFALVLFAGLLVFNFFSEVFNRAPLSITANTSYVKKVVFPLHVLPTVNVVVALFGMLINVGVWLIFYVIAIGPLRITVLLFPVAIVPLILLLIGLSWLFASLGVFFRDLAQITPIVSTAVMFLTPIFYPVQSVPEKFRPLLNFNPLASLIEQVRSVLMWGQELDFVNYLIQLTCSTIIMWLCFIFFQKTRKGFADVL